MIRCGAAWPSSIFQMLVEGHLGEPKGPTGRPPCRHPDLQPWRVNDFGSEAKERISGFGTAALSEAQCFHIPVERRLAQTQALPRRLGAAAVVLEAGEEELAPGTSFQIWNTRLARRSQN